MKGWNMRGFYGTGTRVGARLSAFTLIEMLVVTGMLAILMSMAAGGLGAARNQARVGKANAEIRELVNAWLSYEAAYDDWPVDMEEGDKVDATEENLADLLGKKGGIVYLNAPIVRGAFRDPWGTPYRFRLLKEKKDQTVTDKFSMSVTFPNRHRYFR